MGLPTETWQRMLLVIWAVLLLAAVPLAILSPLRLRQGKPVKAMWIKYGAWFLMAPIVTVPMMLGRVWVQAGFLLASLYAFEEFSRLVGLREQRAHMWLARLCIVAVYVPTFMSNYGVFLALPAYVVLPAFLLPILRDRYEGMVRASCLVMLGVIYCGWFLAHLAYLMNAAAGRQFVLAFLLVVVVNDASAYLVGSTVGRRRLVPKLSPNKTVEGALGAAAITVGTAVAVGFALGGLTLAHRAILGLLLAAAGTCGDLAVSLIKRDVGAKDCGTCIPGHGGLLDRLDSVLLAAPLYFHFMRVFQGAGGLT